MSVASFAQLLPTKLWKRSVSQPAQVTHPVEGDDEFAIAEPTTPEPKAKRRRIQEDDQPQIHLLDLPEDLLLLSAYCLAATDLAFLDLTCKRLRLGSVRILYFTLAECAPLRFRSRTCETFHVGVCDARSSLRSQRKLRARAAFEVCIEMY